MKYQYKYSYWGLFVLKVHLRAFFTVPSKNFVEMLKLGSVVPKTSLYSKNNLVKAIHNAILQIIRSIRKVYI